MSIDIELVIKNYRCFSDEEPAHIVIRDGFTAFVGTNNAGKSSLLRFFYDFRPVFGWLGGVSPVEFCYVQGLQARASIINADIQEIFCNTNERDMEIRMRWRTPASSAEFSLTIPRSGSGSNILSSTLSIGTRQIQKDELKHIMEERYECGDIVIDFLPLREAFWVFTTMLYVGPFRNALSAMPSNSPYFDIAVGQSFIAQWRAWLTGPSREENETAYQLMGHLGKIFEFPYLQIHASHDASKLRMFVDGKSYSMDQFGSGLTQFFLVLAHAAMRKPSFVLIDEPELNLHPSLQLDFLTTLTAYTAHGVLFATHNLGLARASANSLYSVRREAQGRSRVTPYESTPRLAELLGELSFSGYRELGFEKILLVEGVTEVTTIQQFLRLYGKDHHIVLLPMGGAQMINGRVAIQLEEIKRITPHVFAVIDSERSGPDVPLSPSRTEFVECCKRLGIGCHVLRFRATENYLSDRAVKKVLGPSRSALQPYEARSAFGGWAKTDNWRVAREMSREELEKTDLGEFLASL